MYTQAAYTLDVHCICVLHCMHTTHVHVHTWTWHAHMHGMCMHMQVLDDLEQLEGLVGRMPGEGLVESNRAGRVPSFM